MKKVALIGGYDKTDLIIYIAKILTALGKKVIFIDTTITTKSKYLVPTMTPTKKYITTFDGIDVAIGFQSFQEIGEYTFTTKGLDYDYALVDLDNKINYLNFGFEPTDLHFFITSFDVYSVQKGVNVLKAMTKPTEITKVLFTRDPESEESEYLDFITFNYKVKWKKDIIYFPFDTEDLYEIYKNQRFSKVRLNGLSLDYIESLLFFVEVMSGFSRGDIKKAMKIIDKAY